MSAGRTPGQWDIIEDDAFSIDHDDDCDGPFEGAVVSGYVVVGDVEDGEVAIIVCDMNHPNTWDDEKLDAAAALVKAAPDLLAAAQRVLDRGYVSSSIDEEREDHAMLSAAIAKATGQEGGAL